MSGISSLGGRVGVTILEILIFSAGLLLLIKGSDIFVEAATRIAEAFKVSEF